MGKIILEDFNEGNGYYKINLAYLDKEQVEEIESVVSKWNPTDEDIKSCIRMCLTDADEQRFKDYDTNLKDCLAWLEKQSDKDKLIKELGEYKVKYTQEVLGQYLERQREQNPDDKVEQKTTWSEEDELIISVINSLINMAETKTGQWYYNGFKEVFYFDIRQWLKSLKDRVQPQPKQEWSEEERARIDKIVDVLDWAEEKGYIRYSDWEDYICYVKSLKPQNTWKPSDEQIKAIRLARSFVTDDFADNPTLSETLIELEKQLKKLKEK